MKGQCGKKSFFGGQLPCPNNTLAEEPEDDIRKKLVDVCGDSWSEGNICCDGDQVIPTREEASVYLLVLTPK